MAKTGASDDSRPLLLRISARTTANGGNIGIALSLASDFVPGTLIWFFAVST
jgi:hypothetical protein